MAESIAHRHKNKTIPMAYVPSGYSFLKETVWNIENEALYIGHKEADGNGHSKSKSTAAYGPINL